MATHVIIRKANENELGILQKLSEELTVSDSHYDPLLVKNWSFTKHGEKYLKSRILGKRCTCFVAEIEGKIAGYATGAVLKTLTWRKVKRVQLENLLISENYRNRGIGTELITAFVIWGKEMNAERILVEAYTHNTGAVNFYKKTGFFEDSIALEKQIEK